MQGVNDPFNIRKMVAEGSTVEPVTAAEVQYGEGTKIVSLLSAEQ